MAQETLKLVITADNADALAKIKQFSESLGAQTQQFERNKKAVGDATNTLINFGRLAEDSAYGLRGAANNINPFIESFQRLKKETGSTKDALLSMAQGLIGPAGIIVAVSTISTLLISYADSQSKAKKEAEELAKADGNSTDQIKKKKDAIDSIYESTAKEVAQVTTLVSIVENETETRKRKNQALEQLQKIAPDIFNGLKLEGTAVNGLNTAYETYINNINTVIALKIKQAELETLTEKILKIQGVTLTQEEKLIRNIGEAYTKKRIETANENESRKIATDLQAKQNKKDSELNQLLELRKGLLKDIGELSKGQKIGGGNGDGGGDKKDPFVEATKDFNNAVKVNLELLGAAKISQESYFANYLEIVKSYVNKLKGIDTTQAQEKLKALTPKELVKNVSDTYDQDLEAKSAAMDVFDMNPLKRGANIQGNEPTPFSKEAFENGRKEMDKFFKENKKNFKEADDEAEKFAETIAFTATNAIMGLWSAMEQGMSLGEALGEVFINIAKQIAAAALQALLFQVILSAITGGTSLADDAAGGVGKVASAATDSEDEDGGFLGILKKIFAFAEGGIVTGPTLAMIGEAGENEAVMPLSKLSGMLNTTFNAGTMASNGGNGNGEFVLRGQDLVLALNRSETSLKYRRG
jgi:hypothetical protein